MECLQILNYLHSLYRLEYKLKALKQSDSLQHSIFVSPTTGTSPDDNTYCGNNLGMGNMFKVLWHTKYG